MKRGLLFFISVLVASFFAFNVYATDPITNCDQEGDLLGLTCVSQTGLTGTDQPEDLRIVIVRLINISLSLLGIVSVVIILWAGFKWMTAGGNSDDVEKARGIIFAAVIGLLIIMSAWGITRYILTQLYAATTGQSYGGTVIF